MSWNKWRPEVLLSAYLRLNETPLLINRCLSRWLNVETIKLITSSSMGNKYSLSHWVSKHHHVLQYLLVHYQYTIHLVMDGWRVNVLLLLIKECLLPKMNQAKTIDAEWLFFYVEWTTAAHSWCHFPLIFPLISQWVRITVNQVEIEKIILSDDEGHSFLWYLHTSCDGTYDDQ